MKLCNAVLVLAVTLASSPDADADRAAVPSCACPTVVTLPERGATNVPLNAKLWSFGSPSPHTYTASDGVVIPNLHVELPRLEPNQPYNNSDWLMDFTTTNAVDETAPATPSDVSASIATLATGVIDTLWVNARMPADAALVRIDLHDSAGLTTRLVTTPQRMYLCQPKLYVTPGKVTVEVRAIDLAGNESALAATELTTTTVTDSDPELCGAVVAGDHEKPRYHHGRGWEISLLVIVLLPVIVIGWLIVVVVRRLGVARHVAEPIPLLVAEVVARRLSRWHVVSSALLMGIAMALQLTRDWNHVAFLLVPFIVSSLGQLFLHRRALRILDTPNVEAVRRGPWLVVSSTQRSATVRASDVDFEAAEQSCIPQSTAK